MLIAVSGVSDEDKEFIVDQHNHHRKYQYATNMQKMVSCCLVLFCFVFFISINNKKIIGQKNTNTQQ